MSDRAAVDLAHRDEAGEGSGDEGLVGAVAIKLKDPVFESQTKNKLGNTDIKSWIMTETKSAVVDFLHRNADASKKLEDKIVRNEKLRTELNTVRKEAKEAAKKIALKIPNLKDCKYHLGDAEEKGRSCSRVSATTATRSASPASTRTSG